ncbi:hypothetical protein DICVIV_09708 [Dictyocaulus viviparus]|uniref:7TM GPCR serpentine receptor class x (Srx) domain-containing protein n=1 Tax=Dictyocaulus viviparus TaxID=29172 RepID=A0A0D8XI39_DICVI|nr:hypothetical protein DICVIV_09708 [Dictyocaulus viviparus]
MSLTTDVQATPAVRVISALLILFLALIGMVLHFVVLLAFYKGRSSLFKSVLVQLIDMPSFPRLVKMEEISGQISYELQQANCELICNKSQLLWTKSIETNCMYMGDGVIYYVPLFFEGVTYNEMILLLLLLTLNRLTIFIFPKINSVLFSVNNTLLISFLSWNYITITMAVDCLLGCTKYFSKDEFYFSFYCPHHLNDGTFYYHDFLTYQSCLLTALMFLIYLITYIKITRSQHNMNQGFSKKDMSFLIQTIPLSVLLAIEVLTFKFVPLLGITGMHRFIIVGFENVLIIACSTISSLVLLIFNGDVRKLVRNQTQSNVFTTARI